VPSVRDARRAGGGGRLRGDDRHEHTPAWSIRKHPGYVKLPYGDADQAVFGTGSWGPYPDPLMPGLWNLEGGQTATGSIVRWVEQTAGGGRSLAELGAEATAAGLGAHRLLALDFWQSNRSPRQDPLARTVHPRGCCMPALA